MDKKLIASYLEDAYFLFPRKYTFSERVEISKFYSKLISDKTPLNCVVVTPNDYANLFQTISIGVDCQAPKVSVVLAYPFGVTNDEARYTELMYVLMDKYASGYLVGVDFVVNYRDRVNTNILRMYGRTCKAFGIESKAILEVSALSKDDVSNWACAIEDSDVSCIKTCTGFYPENLKMDFESKLILVERIKELAPSKKIKFSGGVKSLEQVKKLINSSYIDYIGTSSTVNILKEYDDSIKGNS